MIKPFIITLLFFGLYEASHCFAQVQPNDSVTYNLSEVTIKAKRKLMTNKDGKLVYNVKADPESKSLNLMQSLRKMPVVQVFDDQTITVAGSRKFKVLLNGKEYAVMQNNLSDLIKTIKASDLDRYEVITNPTNKYIEQGYNAVLNIVTISGRAFKGYSTNIAATSNDYASTDLSAFGTIQLEKMILSADVKICRCKE